MAKITKPRPGGFIGPHGNVYPLDLPTQLAGAVEPLTLVPTVDDGITGFLSNTVKLAGYDIPVWALIAAGVAGYYMFVKGDKK